MMVWALLGVGRPLGWLVHWLVQLLLLLLWLHFVKVAFPLYSAPAMREVWNDITELPAVEEGSKGDDRPPQALSWLSAKIMGSEVAEVIAGVGRKATSGYSNLACLQVSSHLAHICPASLASICMLPRLERDPPAFSHHLIGGWQLRTGTILVGPVIQKMTLPRTISWHELVQRHWEQVSAWDHGHMFQHAHL